MLAPSDYPQINALSLVTADVLTKMGFNLDLVSTDWGTVIQRRASQAPVERGGWSVFHSTWSGADIVNPAINQNLRANGQGAWFGWPSDPAIETLRAAWIDAGAQPDRKRLADEIQVHAMDTVPVRPARLLLAALGLAEERLRRVPLSDHRILEHLENRLANGPHFTASERTEPRPARSVDAWCSRGEYAVTTELPEILHNDPRQDLPLADDKVLIVEEVARVEKRLVETGRATIRVSTSEHDETIETMLRHQAVSVERKPMDLQVSAAPPTRQEGDTIVLSIVEERVIVEKRLFLTEEVHIRIDQTPLLDTQVVHLRREHAEIDVDDQANHQHPERIST